MSFSVKKNNRVSFSTSSSPLPFPNPSWSLTNTDISNINTGMVMINTVDASSSYNLKNYTLGPKDIDVSGQFKTSDYYDLTNFNGNVGEIVSRGDQYNTRSAWAYQDSEYQAYNMFPEDTAYNIAFSRSSSTFLCGNGVMGPNGIMYFAPFNDNNFYGSNSASFIYNPYNGNRMWLKVGFQIDRQNFCGGSITAPNGSMYFLPYGNLNNALDVSDSDASSILVINPYITSGSSMSITMLGNDVNPLCPNTMSVQFLMPVLGNEGGIGWRGLASRYIPNITNPELSKTTLYGVPWNSKNVLKIDWKTNTANVTDLSNITVANYPAIGVTDISKWYGGVLAPNGNIYCTPNNAQCVMKIIPSLNGPDTLNFDISNINTTTYPFLTGNNNKWRGGCLAPDGKIYCCPYNSNCVLIINPSNDTINLTDISGFSGSYTGAVLAPNGKIYCAPTSGTNVLVIIPSNLPSLSSGRRWYTINISSWGTINSFGPILSPTGNVIISCWNCNPFNPTNRGFPCISTGLPKYPLWMLAPEFNKV